MALRVVDWRVVVGGALAIALGLALWACVRLFAMPLAVLVLSITVADALSPAVDLLGRWLSRPVAASLAFLLLLAVIVLVGYLLVPKLAQQAQALIAQAPTVLVEIQNRLAAQHVVSAAQLSQLGSNLLARAGSFVVGLPLRLSHALFGMAVMFFLALYWTIAAPSLAAFTQSLFPEPRRARVGSIQHEMQRAMGGYVRGVVIDALITGGLAGGALFLAGIDYPALLGALTAVGELVPVIGPVTAAVPAIAVGLAQSPAKALIALAIYTAIVQLEGHVIAPNVMSRQTNISQATVIFAFFAGGVVGGLVGAIAAIPLAGAAKVLMVDVGAPAIRRWSGAAPVVQTIEPPPPSGGQSPL